MMAQNKKGKIYLWFGKKKMSIIYHCPEQRNIAQIKRCGAARAILAKYNTPVTDVSVSHVYDHALVAYLKTHPGNVARLEFPQIVVNNIIVGPVGDLQAADEDGRLANYVRSVPKEVQQAIALNASLLEESNKSQKVQRERERKEHEEEKRKLAEQIRLKDEKLREEREREEERRKERELKLQQQRKEEAILQTQRDLHISQISERVTAVQQKEKQKENQRKAYETILSEDEENLKRLPTDLQAMVNQINSVVPQLFKRTIIPICQKFQNFDEAIDFVFENQSKLEEQQPKFPLVDVAEEPESSVGASLLESSLYVSTLEEQPSSATFNELSLKNATLESENTQLKEDLKEQQDKNSNKKATGL